MKTSAAVVLPAVPAGAIGDLVDVRAVNMNLSRAVGRRSAVTETLVGDVIGGATWSRGWAVCGQQRGGAVLGQRRELWPVIGAVARWRGHARPASAVAREHVVDAVRAGARYVAGSPALRVILLRAGS